MGSMSEIMMKLSDQLEAAIPQLMLVALARKLVSLCMRGMGFAITCTPFAKGDLAVSFARAYKDAKACFDALWSCAYFAVLLYATYNLITNLGDFLHCKPSTTPRPMGVFSAIALTCFIFTTRLSASTMSLVVMLCAKQHNMLAGIAACVNVATWSNQKGAGVLLSVCGTLSLVHYMFCGQSSGAALTLACFAWILVWIWLAVIDLALEAHLKKKKRD